MIKCYIQIGSLLVLSLLAHSARLRCSIKTRCISSPLLSCASTNSTGSSEKCAINGLCVFVLYVSFGQGSSLLWTHTLRLFYSRPIALTQEGRSLVNDVCVTEG